MSMHILLQPYQSSDADPFDAVKAAHLLNRAGFGGTAEEITKVMAIGPAKAVEWLLDFPDQPAKAQGKDLPDFASIEGLNTDYRELRKMMVGKTPLEQKEMRQKVQMANRQAVMAVINWWLNRMADGSHPLQEKLTLFWHGHFVTSDKDERSASLLWNQNELLRQNAAGNFRTFVRKISRDPAMLDYLNNTQNRKAHPNENYARELMELFTLGIGNYTEVDVKQAARAFTGWAHDGDDYVFRKFDHDYGQKLFMGQTGDFNGDDVIDIILSQKVAAKFIATKLFRFFAYEEVDEYLSDALGTELRSANYEIRPLLKTILNSKAFYSPAAIGSQIKSPIQLVLGTIRLMGMRMPPAQALLGPLNQMGQVPLSPPNVRGWPGGRMWINTSTLFVRYNTGTRLLDIPRARNEAHVPEGIVNGDPAKTVDYWLNRLVQRPVTADKRQILVDSLSGATDERDVRRMIQLIVSMPEYQLC